MMSESKPPRSVFANKLGDYFRPTENPTHCARCRARVSISKAIRRFNRATRQVQQRVGYCSCGHILYFR